jgi:hypothetical protein
MPTIGNGSLLELFLFDVVFLLAGIFVKDLATGFAFDFDD